MSASAVRIDAYETSDTSRGTGVPEVGGAVATVTLTLAVSLSRGDGPTPVEIAFAGVLGLLAAGDLRRGIIPNRLVYPAVVVALAISPLRQEMALASTVAGMVAAGVPFMVLFIAAPGSVGGGDVKMAALVGTIVGFPEAMDALIAAVIVGGFAAAVVSWRRPSQRGTTIPYGPFLASGALLTML